MLVDKTDGELDRILARLGSADDVARPYDAYLNAFVRGKAAARRGDELGARLHAADSVKYLVEALAAVDGRRPRFHDRLAGTLGAWEPRLLAILRDPDVDAQLVLCRESARMQSHASGHTMSGRYISFGEVRSQDRRAARHHDVVRCAPSPAVVHTSAST